MNHRGLLMTFACLAGLAGAAMLSSGGKGGASAAPPQAAAGAPAAAAAAGGARGPNERFYSTQAKLDPGGSFYLYIDTKDQLKALADTVKPMLDSPNVPPLARQPLQMVLAEFERSGLYDIQDLGMSSLPQGEMHRTKFFMGLPGPRKGLLALLGGPAHPITALDYAPADTLAFSTVEFDLAGLLQFVRDAIKNIGGPQALQNFNGQLQTLGAQLGINPDALVKSIAGRYTLVGTLDPTSKMTLAGGPKPVQIDSPHLALIVDVKDDSLYQALHALLTLRGMAGQETAAGEMKQFPIPVPANPEWQIAPIVATDKGHFYFATHADYLQKILAAQKSGGGLAQSDDFKKLSEGMALQGNDLSYISPRVGEVVDQVMQASLAGMPASQRTGAEPLLSGAALKGGSFGLTANQADGIQSVTRSAVSGHAIFSQLLVPILSRAGLNAPLGVAAGSGGPEVSSGGGDAPTLLKIVAVAIEAYNVDHNAYPLTGHLETLTSPVAYLGRLPADPYSPEGAMFHYYMVPAGQGHGAGWILWSAGPDQQYDLTPENIRQAYDPTRTVPSALLLLRTYDPSNGPGSGGDIWKAKE